MATDAPSQAGSGRGTAGVPDPVVSRLPLYLNALDAFALEGQPVVSSDELATRCGTGAAILRRDLSYLSASGRRGIGYRTADLAEAIRSFLGLNTRRDVVIVGVGRLGSALAGYPGFGDFGFDVRAVVDVDPAKIGTQRGNLTVRSTAELPAIVEDFGITLGLLTVPAHAAQAAADHSIDSGLLGLLNFAPTLVSVPAGITVRNVDVARELQLLAFYTLAAHPQAEPEGEPRREGVL